MTFGMDLTSVTVGLVLLTLIDAAPLCLPCESRFGVVTECNSTHSTSCAPCRQGHEFNPERSFFNPCKPCTICETKSFESKRCTPKSDTICMECDVVKGQNNFSGIVDFRRECLGEHHVNLEEKEPVVSWLEYSLSNSQYAHSTINRRPLRWARNSREGSQPRTKPSPEWDGISGLGPLNADDPLDATYDSTEINDDLLKEEGFLPGRATATDARPPDSPGTSFNDPGTLIDWSDIGSGSGAAPLMRDVPSYTTGKDDYEEIRAHDNNTGPVTMDIAKPSPEKEDAVDDTTDQPVVLQNYEAEEALLNKEAKVGIIIGSVVAGVVVCILSCFVFFKLKRRHGKNTKNGNVYIEASIDQDNRLTSKIDVSKGDQSEVNLDNETTPLSATPNGTISHNENSDGVYQLPIDIVSSDVIRDPALQEKPLKFDYVPENGRQSENNGDTVKIRFQNDLSVLSGGPLASRSYRLSECHFHWGSKDSQGSEHTVNGRSYPGELHLVHNESQRSQESLNTACTRGLAVVAVFLEVGDDHEGIELITHKLPTIKYKGETADISPALLDPVSLLPDDRMQYWTYTESPVEAATRGSTTWIVFREPIHISSSQLESFRQLRRHEKNEQHSMGSEDIHLVDNFRRPLAPPGEHAVTSSF